MNEHYRIKGPILRRLSPQRTPVLIHAGSSVAGKQAAGFSRDSSNILFFQGHSFVIGGTEGLAAHIGRDQDIDFGLRDPDRPFAGLNIRELQGFIRFVQEANPDKTVHLKHPVTAMSYNDPITRTSEGSSWWCRCSESAISFRKIILKGRCAKSSSRASRAPYRAAHSIALHPSRLPRTPVAVPAPAATSFGRQDKQLLPEKMRASGLRAQGDFPPARAYRETSPIASDHESRRHGARRDGFWRKSRHSPQ